MRVSEVQFGEYKYDFYYGEHILQDIVSIPSLARLEQLVIIADDQVPESIVCDVENSLRSAFNTHVLRFPAGEKHKDLTTVAKLADDVIESGANRKTGIIAVGGGLTGNVAGMVACLLFRGLPLIHIPTTLMAASDSVLSLKQAVNMNRGKNLMGQFYEPLFVYSEIKYLKSLPIRDIQSGLCELVKNLLAIKPDQIGRFIKILREDNVYTTEQYEEFIDFCIEAKTSVMCNDPYERHEGLALEYGHTIGHALELACKGEYRHGECVAFGMSSAAKISQRLGLLTQEEVDVHIELLERIGVRINPDPELFETIKYYIKNDNKKGYRSSHPDKSGFVLLNGLGHVNIESNSYITLVDDEIIFDVLKEQLQGILI
ncbi:hypothetical protein CBW65_04420 [Tumebacillus avium]|uniref:Uncharacterized protein n=1 Tax=Tumebacillus avium TaxID=1903704 RepID=A0A1Y0ILK5_9BACL|nr:2-deoxy-scyllo-inosose synthase [Tumebacillus avium]ARU60395.1 hypothetical protein CBW65_04420 [Tumebacillus avium]